LANPTAPETSHFVFKQKGGALDGRELFVETESRELANAEAKRIEAASGCALRFVRYVKVETKPPARVPIKPRVRAQREE